MPIFTYVCNECDKETDKLVSRKEADNGVDFPCADEGCVGRLHKSEVPTAADLRFKGRWFATTRGY